jgi:hypothetical protein
VTLFWRIEGKAVVFYLVFKDRNRSQLGSKTTVYEVLCGDTQLFLCTEKSSWYSNLFAVLWKTFFLASPKCSQVEKFTTC